jgi:signal peptidase I
LQWVIVLPGFTGVFSRCEQDAASQLSANMNPQALKEGRCSLVAEALREWGVLKIRATGVSMLPTLWPGDLLTVQSRQLEEIEPGEIVLYRRRGRFFIHRCVSKSLTGDDIFLIARGDSMPGDDPPVRGDQVLGKITEIQRSGSVFSPARKLSPFRRMVGYMLCHWGLFRRVGLRLWGRCHRGDGQIDVALVEAAS